MVKLSWLQWRSHPQYMPLHAVHIVVHIHHSCAPSLSPGQLACISTSSGWMVQLFSKAQTKCTMQYLDRLFHTKHSKNNWHAGKPLYFPTVPVAKEKQLRILTEDIILKHTLFNVKGLHHTHFHVQIFVFIRTVISLFFCLRDSFLWPVPLHEWCTKAMPRVQSLARQLALSQVRFDLHLWQWNLLSGSKIAELHSILGFSLWLLLSNEGLPSKTCLSYVLNYHHGFNLALRRVPTISHHKWYQRCLSITWL